MLKKPIFWIIVGAVILIIAIVFLLLRKPTVIVAPPSGDGTGNGGNGDDNGDDEDCLTEMQYKIKKEDCHKKCAANLLIPFVGIGAYKGCNLKCVEKIPPIC